MTLPQFFQPIRDCDLPVFRQDHPLHSIFYSPGYVAVVVRDHVMQFEDCVRLTTRDRWSAVTDLREHALAARRSWAEAQMHPFSPTCLTVYLNNECNLKCVYCFSIPSSHPSPRLTLSSISAGAEFVTQNCQALGTTFTVVFHGGGEPTLHKEAVDCAMNEIERIAAKYDLPVFRYIATNGVMSTDKAMWMAKRFDLVGLSCDGPSSIQARQRPLLSGENTSGFVERTARIVREAGKTLHSRVTVTPQSLACLTEIAEYICQQIKPQEIHVEPVYKAGRARTGESFKIDQSETFVDEYLKARAVAQHYGIRWLTSGNRLTEIHGSYCNVFRDVLNLVPDGTATACFKATTAAQAHKQQTVIGRVDSTSGRFVIDSDRIQHLRQILIAAIPRCDGCFNRFHCVRDCPDWCPLDETAPSSEFRCQTQKLLANKLLQAEAASLLATGTYIAEVVGGKVTV